MLAGPRYRKAKLTINPQGNTWSKDDSKFGQKILEGLGWNKGEGLGIDGKGRADHVTVKLKNDSTGIGFDHTKEYVDHQDGFNCLLDSLNEDHGQEVNNSGTNQVLSLEKQSQKSRSRIHYSKFTRGKDLSSKTDSDLNCIFGRSRSKRGKNDSELKTNEETPVEEESLTTITSSSTIQEYFQQKMANLLKRKSGDICIEAPVKVKKAKKNKRKEESINNKDMSDDDTACNIECDETLKGDVKTKHKKKKHKRAKICRDIENNVEVEEIESITLIDNDIDDKTDVLLEPDCSDVSETAIVVKQKKKKKKKKVKKDKNISLLHDSKDSLCEKKDKNISLLHDSKDSLCESLSLCDTENAKSRGDKMSKSKKKKKKSRDDIQVDIVKKEIKQETESEVPCTESSVDTISATLRMSGGHQLSPGKPSGLGKNTPKQRDQVAENKDCGQKGDMNNRFVEKGRKQPKDNFLAALINIQGYGQFKQSTISPKSNNAYDWSVMEQRHQSGPLRKRRNNFTRKQ